jgi:hypothetical protein
MKVIILTITVLMLVVGLAGGGQGEVCYSSSMPIAQAEQLTNNTRFDCPSLGQVTIPEIYQIGWRVAHLSSQAVQIDLNNPASVQAVWMILIEMP